MYEQFYGLKRRPFELNPDPRFFFPTPSHNEALATLSSVVLHRKGFGVITGEVGAGKTLLLRYLMEFLARNNITYAYVDHPEVSVLEFLVHVLNDLRLSVVGRTQAEMLSYLGHYVSVRSRRGTTTAIIVDQAHLLARPNLEAIYPLTNLEVFESKALQMILAGPPDLERKLYSAELRQLNERLNAGCRLKPLALAQLQGYIDRRLKLAGAESLWPPLFPSDAIELIYELSRGVPRLVNIVCGNSLISGYQRRERQIKAEVVHEVAATLRLNEFDPPREYRKASAAS